MTIILNFNHALNESLQVGDIVYYCPNQQHGTFDTVDNVNLPNTGIVQIGNCILVNRNSNTINVLVNPALPQQLQQQIARGLGIGDFIMFNKSNQVNANSLVGYYASVTLENNSPHEAELFAISAEFSESSK